MKPGSKILVIGATGAIGSAVVKALLADETNNWKIHAFTRNPMSDRAHALKQMDPQRIRLVQGNNNDISSIKEALDDVQGVFCNTDFGSAGLQENLQGKRIVEACKWKNIDYFVYLALDYAKEISLNYAFVPHYDTKGEVEKTIADRRSSGDNWFQNHTSVLTVVPLMENFKSKWKPVYENNKAIFKLPLQDKKIPLIAIDDIAWFTAHLFANQARFKGKTIKIAGDALSGAEIAQQYGEIINELAEYQPVDEVNDPIMGREFKFLREYGISRDYDEIRNIYPDIKTFKQWLRLNS